MHAIYLSRTITFLLRVVLRSQHHPHVHHALQNARQKIELEVESLKKEAEVEGWKWWWWK